MHIQVKALGLTLTDDLAAFIDDHIVAPIRRTFDRSGPRLEIEVSDDNGAKGGVDKRCRITFETPHARTVNIEEWSADIYTAVDLAGHRFRRRVREIKSWKLQRTRYPTKYFLAKQELDSMPGAEASPEDVTQENDSLAAFEARGASEDQPGA